MIDIYRTAAEPSPLPPLERVSHCTFCHRCAQPGCTAATHPAGEHYVRVGMVRYAGVYGSEWWRMVGYQCDECGDTWK